MESSSNVNGVLEHLKNNPKEFTIENLITKWKNNLIDTSKRNKLTNFKFKDTNAMEIYFGKSKNFDDISELYNLSSSGKTISTEHLTTNFEEFEKGQKLLYKLYLKSKNELKEKGTNILYLTFGLLEWYESEDSDLKLYSPLVMVPISLNRNSKYDPFTFKRFEDEAVINPSLAYKLKMDFGIDISEDISIEDMNILDYFNILQEKISRFKRWKISNKSYISLFSFNKLVMLKDLDELDLKIKRNFLIKALSGESVGMIPSGTTLPHAEELDSLIAPCDSYQVLDADSSQQEAIVAAKLGASFVLQGPPGTGKSQTITNIISECLIDGKKILFVSEKMAALDVVKKRLDEVGLGQFCLELHSYKMNKKDLINNLYQTYEDYESGNIAKESFDYVGLKYDRNILNAYVKSLHKLHYPLGKSAYNLHGELSKLSEIPEVCFDLKNTLNYTEKDLNRLEYNLEQLAANKDKIIEFNKSFWKYLTVSDYRLSLKSELESNFLEMSQILENINSRLTLMSEEIGLEKKLKISELEWLSKFLSLSMSNPVPLQSWFDFKHIPILIDISKNFKEKFNEYNNQKIQLLGKINEKAFGTDVSKLRTILDENFQIISETLYSKNKNWMNYNIMNLECKHSIESLVNNSQNLKNDSEKLLSKLGFSENLLNIRDIGTLNEIVHILSKHKKLPKNTILNAKTLKNEYLKDSEAFEKYSENRTAILKSYDEKIFELDVEDLINKFKTEYNSFFKYLKPKYRKDKKLLLGFRKDLKSPSDSEILSDLYKIKDTNKVETLISKNKDKYIKTYGELYSGISTDWEFIGTVLEKLSNIELNFGIKITSKTVDCIKNPEEYADIENILEDIEYSIKTIESKIYSLKKLTFGELNFDLRKYDLSELNRRFKELNYSVHSIHELSNDLKKDDFSKMSYEDLKNILDAIKKFQKLENRLNSERNQLSNNFGRYYAHENTDWDTLDGALRWTSSLNELFRNVAVPEEYLEYILQNSKKLDSEMEFTNNLINKYKAKKTYLENIFDLPNLKINSKMFTENSISEVSQWMESVASESLKLEENISFKKMISNAEYLGFDNLIEFIENKNYENYSLKDIYLKRLYTLNLENIYSKDSILNSFKKEDYEKILKEFKILDKEQFKSNITRIQNRLLIKCRKKIDSLDFELKILKKEYNKQKRHLPIRALLSRIPNLTWEMKPCFLMSPMSVSTYLGSQNFDFDLVIFDEASQILPEDAIGSIIRGKQVIVVGDSKQMPPTKFFTSSLDDPESDEEFDETYESILDQCSTVMPEKSLKWHYRSKHESLIAFSNKNFYKNRLHTFPSSDNSCNSGLKFVHVENGVYDRSMSRTNKKEARKVAELTIDHFKNHPTKSLGIIAFSEAQQMQIIDEVECLMEDHPELRPLMDESNEESFFIKNLENVQGHERDVIFFSVGYAKDHAGDLKYNFGPLSRQGGERRLNVAITRAKHHIKLVSSIMPEEIDLMRTNSRGAKLLREYLEFAKYGNLPESLDYNNELEFDSPFEEDVYDSISGLGYDVHSQVGCSGYRIDLAVIDPNNPGKYLMGIECDGASYHSSKSARDRDRLRQQVLESLGWNIYRIWSQDWFKRKKFEIEKIDRQLKDIRGNVELVHDEDFKDKSDITNEILDKTTLKLETDITKYSEDETNVIDNSISSESEFNSLNNRIESEFTSNYEKNRSDSINNLFSNNGETAFYTEDLVDVKSNDFEITDKDLRERYIALQEEMDPEKRINGYKEILEKATDKELNTLTSKMLNFEETNVKKISFEDEVESNIKKYSKPETIESSKYSLNDYSNTFSAISDETRLTILELLLDSDGKSVQELIEILQKPQPTISHHLAILKSANLISDISKGTYRIYSVVNSKKLLIESIMQLLEHNVNKIDILKAISDETRLTILELLLDSDGKSVQELIEILQKPQPTISHHINILKSANLLKLTKKGRFNQYSVENNNLKELLKMIANQNFDPIKANNTYPKNDVLIAVENEDTASYYCIVDNCIIASGKILPENHFLVNKGSKALITGENGVGTYPNLIRSQLLRSGALTEKGGYLVFNTDYMFGSYKTALEVVLGNSSENIFWANSKREKLY
jgi:superfamily I DNA and/or RNA helicase/DNA-binding transcriptional ArsR family regulator/very-short-patch-repair endonuclease